MNPSLVPASDLSALLVDVIAPSASRHPARLCAAGDARKGRSAPDAPRSRPQPATGCCAGEMLVGQASAAASAVGFAPHTHARTHPHTRAPAHPHHSHHPCTRTLAPLAPPAHPHPHTRTTHIKDAMNIPKSRAEEFMGQSNEKKWQLVCSQVRRAGSSLGSVGRQAQA